VGQSVERRVVERVREVLREQVRGAQRDRRYRAHVGEVAAPGTGKRRIGRVPGPEALTADGHQVPLVDAADESGHLAGPVGHRGGLAAGVGPGLIDEVPGEDGAGVGEAYPVCVPMLQHCPHLVAVPGTGGGGAEEVVARRGEVALAASGRCSLTSRI